MTDDKRPWTTNLGEIIAELNASGAPEPHVKAVENELIHAIQCVRHVRRCYQRPASSTTISK